MMSFKKTTSTILAATLILSGALIAPAAQAGEDDDARFLGNGVTRNNRDPIQTGGLLADYPTNVEPNTGLRVQPPTGTQLLKGQRFDLRVETQIPSTNGQAPVLKSLTVNGTDVTASFTAKIAAQDAADPSGVESGKGGLTSSLYGNTVRNLSFNAPGIYTVTAVVTVDGVDRTVTNVYPVADFALRGNVKHVAFFLGDAMGLPVRTAARIAGKGVFEGRAKGKLNMDRMDEYGLTYTASFDSLITDSAPGMANYITGLKQPNNSLNASGDNTPGSGSQRLDNPRIETLWEYMKRVYGWKIGIVADAFITDATPASAAAHTRSRGERFSIAQQYLDLYRDGSAQPATGYAGLRELTQPLDVIIGSGARDFLPDNNVDLINFYRYAATAGRDDGLNLFTEATALGYSVVKNLTELNAAPSNKPLLGIFVGDFRPGNALGVDNVPGTLDRLVARGLAKINGQDATNPALGLTAAVSGTGTCGATVQACFQSAPSKKEMVAKAVEVLNTLAGPSGGWMLLIEQSQSDKLAHPLEYERVIYEALELDEALGFVLNDPTLQGNTLSVVTADHAQPETIIGVALPGSIIAGGATAPGGCFATTGGSYPITLGSVSLTSRPCDLQDVVGTFNDGTFTTYVDANSDGYPDDPDPTIKLVIDDGGRPTYSQDYLTNFIPLSPSGSSAALPNPNRDPNGILLTGNMPTRNVLPSQPNPGAALTTASANKTNGNTGVAPHSGEDVPISASGPGADLFAGTYDNTDVHVRIGFALSGKLSRRNLNLGSPYTGVPTTTPAGTNLTGF